MLIYVNITDRQTHQNYSSEPHKINDPSPINHQIEKTKIIFSKIDRLYDYLVLELMINLITILCSVIKIPFKFVFVLRKKTNIKNRNQLTLIETQKILKNLKKL